LRRRRLRTAVGWDTSKMTHSSFVTFSSPEDSELRSMRRVSGAEHARDADTFRKMCARATLARECEGKVPEGF